VLGLVGFLAQMVVAMEVRLIPLAAWFWAVDREPLTPPMSPHQMRDRTFQTIVFAAWSSAVPLLAAGMFAESARLVGAGAWILFAGVAVATLDTLFVVAHAVGRRPPRTSAVATAVAPAAAHRSG